MSRYVLYMILSRQKPGTCKYATHPCSKPAAIPRRYSTVRLSRASFRSLITSPDISSRTCFPSFWGPSLKLGSTDDGVARDWGRQRDKAFIRLGDDDGM